MKELLIFWLVSKLPMTINVEIVFFFVFLFFCFVTLESDGSRQKKMELRILYQIQ